MIIVLGVIIVLAIIGIVAGTTLINDNNDTNNATVNITNNTTQVNNTTNNTTANTTTTAKKSSSDDSDVVSVSDQENLQAGDGSHYKEVEYADGNFRQYSYDGKLIGSSYESDQDQLPSME